MASEYRRKRDFSQTPEPSGDSNKVGSGERFVVQRHEARRLHYDLRLEMDGTLKSWAVPKGPSMNPADKRLAVQTEDHPLDYLEFEGTIPPGNYGAGNVQIWDIGTYKVTTKKAGDSQPLDHYEKGRLSIEFSGSKLRGAFSLVKTGKSDPAQWLLIKKADKHATRENYDAELQLRRRATSGRRIRESNPEIILRPMLAGRSPSIFDADDWIYEIKWDGYRAIAVIIDGQARLLSRNGMMLGHRFPEIVRDLEQLPDDAILDGEIVLLNEDGLPQFQQLQHYKKRTKGELRYYVFDVLRLNEEDLTALPLLERKKRIPALIKKLRHVYFCDHVERDGRALFDLAKQKKLEGVVAKRADSRYFPGLRSNDWLKVKTDERQEAVIVGYTVSDAPAMPFGALILGAVDEGKLCHIGNCGTGFDAKERNRLMTQFNKIESEETALSGRVAGIKGNKPVWLKPELVCEVAFSGWTASGRMRHPVYKGLRDDKQADDVAVETPTTEDNAPASVRTARSGGDVLTVDGIDVTVTNLDKIYWPEEGFRKVDLIEYYLSISDFILPLIVDRPQSLHRFPNGIHGQSFFQKEIGDSVPDWIETIEVFSKTKERAVRYMLCQNAASLVYMANLGCIEINPWLSRRDALDSPDLAVIDLDPSPNNSFVEVIEVALVARRVLNDAGITGFCKTSGGRGLHIQIPLKSGYTHDEARDFAKLLCHHIRAIVPQLTTLERSIRRRKGRIYLDYLQNGEGQTIATAYCARPRPGATVSVPLEWDEVNADLRREDYTIKTVPNRLREKGDLLRGLFLRKHANAIEVALEHLSAA